MTKIGTRSVILIFVLAISPTIHTPAEEAGEVAIEESEFCRSLEYVGVAVQEPGYHVWCTSPILGEDGSVHLFVARWPIKPHKFDEGWRHDSEIAHYVGERPEGPFRFRDVALRGKFRGQSFILDLVAECFGHAEA